MIPLFGRRDPRIVGSFGPLKSPVIFLGGHLFCRKKNERLRLDGVFVSKKLL